VASLVEHLNGLGLIALAEAEELIELDARLLLICGEPCAFETLGTGLRGDECGRIDKLACLQCDQLIAGLASGMCPVPRFAGIATWSRWTERGTPRNR
jgi:hypothetical protein